MKKYFHKLRNSRVVITNIDPSDLISSPEKWQCEQSVPMIGFENQFYLCPVFIRPWCLVWLNVPVPLFCVELYPPGGVHQAWERWAGLCAGGRGQWEHTKSEGYLLWGCGRAGRSSPIGWHSFGSKCKSFTHWFFIDKPYTVGAVPDLCILCRWMASLYQDWATVKLWIFCGRQRAWCSWRYVGTSCPCQPALVPAPLLRPLWNSTH